MLWNLCVRLWKDEAGAVVSTEYLMLASIVAAGGATGMAGLRDSVNDEFKGYGQDMHEIRQSYMPTTAQGAKVTPASRGVSGLTPAQQPVQTGAPVFSAP